MARYGFLACTRCKEEIFLGKWLRDDDATGLGFWHGGHCEEGEADSQLLGRKVLRFVARHMDHELLAMSDTGGRAEEVWEAPGYEEEWRDADDEYDALARAGTTEEVLALILSERESRKPAE